MFPVGLLERVPAGRQRRERGRLPPSLGDVPGLGGGLRHGRGTRVLVARAGGQCRRHRGRGAVAGRLRQQCGTEGDGQGERQRRAQTSPDK
ncbi:hypothetical protein [Streptomyces fungicidicus]|uniref:hypothetical protein n=1 Tax=Streptomyces fungicidicus TaxID=68203 RepID=UPI0038117541